MKDYGRKFGAKGFTLVELMVTVAIVSMLLAVAVPSYRTHVARANRAQIEASMMKIALREESYFTANNAYCTSSATCSWLAGYDGASQYSVAVTVPGVAGSGSAYDIVATPVTGYSDEDCGKVTLNALNQKFSEHGTVSTCWK